MYNLNVISTENYLFSPELVEALKTGKLPETKNEYIYLVFIRTLNKEDKKLVYNYVRYNELFSGALILFLVNRSNYNAEYFSE